MCNINTVMFKILIEKWRKPQNIDDATKLNRLADETIKAVNSDPLIKEICNIFMYSIAQKALNDPSFRAMQGQMEKRG